MSKVNERTELLELANQCALRHYEGVYFVFITIYPALGAFKDHFAIGCGKTQAESDADFSTKLSVAISSLDDEEVTDRLGRIKLTRAYELNHPAKAG